MALTPPSGLTVGTITCKAITVSWTNNDVPSGRTANVPQRNIASVWTDATSLGPTSTAYTFNNLTPGANHEVRVCAKVTGTTYCSTSVTATTLYMSNPTGVAVAYDDCAGTKAIVTWVNASTNGTSLKVVVLTGLTTIQTNTMPTMSTTGYTVTGLTGGVTYGFQVQVSCGIYGYNSNVVTKTMPSQLSAQVNVAPSNCYGASNGSISLVNRQGGLGTWQQSINSGGTWQSSATFSGLAPGTYDVWMRDATLTSCYITFDDNVITEPDLLYATAIGTNASPGGSDGIITFSNMSGGTGFYEYSSDSGTTFSTNPITGLSPGTYACWIRDLVTPLCKVFVANVVVGEDVFTPNQFCAKQNYTVTNTTCGNSTGSINIVNAYNTYYDFILTDISGNTKAFTGLTAGWYFLSASVKPAYYYLLGNDNCFLQWIQVVDTNTTITLDAIKLKHAVCQSFGNTDGRILLQFTDSNTGATSWHFTLWNNRLEFKDSQTLSAITNVIYTAEPDVYYGILENNLGCTILIDLIKIQSTNIYTIGGIQRLFLTPWVKTIGYNYYSSSDEDWYVSGVDTLLYTSTKLKEYFNLPDFWYEIKLDTATMTYSQNLNRDSNGLTYNETITISIPGCDNAKWKQLVNILSQRYLLVFQDNMDNWWTSFYRTGAEVKSYKLADNQYVITFTYPTTSKMLTAMDYAYVKNSIL